MEKVIFILLMLLFVKESNSQTLVTRRIPLIKESPQIDSMIDSASKSFDKETSCFMIDVQKRGERYFFVIQRIDKAHSCIYLKNINILNSPNLRFFDFKNHLIFVVGAIDPFNLFKRTSNRKLIKFKIMEKADKVPPTIKELYSENYLYDNGKIILYNNIKGVR